MSLTSALPAIRSLIGDTFRQALASGIFWVIVVVSGLCCLVCLSAGISGDVELNRPNERPEFLPQNLPVQLDAKQVAMMVGAPTPASAGYLYAESRPDLAKMARHGVDVVSGELTLAFGAIRLSLGRDARTAVHFLQLVLAGGVADTLGLLLALVWTAGFLPSFLEASAISVLLVKPIPRWSILAGKYLSVLVFVAFHALLFVGSTWAALGFRTGIWDPVYLWCIPILLLHFTIFFSFSTLLAVSTRSTVVCVFGSVVFWALCWGMNYGRHAVLTIPGFEAVSGSFVTLVEAGYWFLPKPADLGILLFNALDAGSYFGQDFTFQAIQERGYFHPELSILASLLFTVGMLALAAHESLSRPTTDPPMPSGA
jgi:hypothetical protein